ncbi:efflux transporter outer membrane subunit [Altererythrobacter sp. ZODW24]|uniref:efflux transporter outer membrane subunit n=1 Tax=Altererythrobacter sp. ZODW24 TaxID=2185142 RepID=UPI000DF86885|nr:efflux transporter outer membrane subunit [Altererythrobacter sp. ZODW24]
MRVRALLLAGLASITLGACVAGPPAEIATPTPVLPEAFSYTPTGSEAATLAALLPSRDPAYSALSELALAQSPTLGEALLRIDAARASADRAGANRLPQITAGASIEGSRTNQSQIADALPPGVSIDTEQVAYGASLNAGWDLDLFGRLRAQERAAIARIDAAGADAAAVRLALLGEIAATVIDWRTLSARQASLESDLGAANELARLAGSRERAGISPGFDRVRAESAAAASKSRLSALESERARLVGRLVTLTATSGQTVRTTLELGAPETGLPAAPAAAPSILLANRPDVLAASSRLAASDADLAATAASRFPNISLSGAIGLLAFNPADLFDEDSLIGSLGAALAAPLFDFGRVEAEIDAAETGKRIAFQSYRGAVFTALGDAEAAYGLVTAADNELAAVSDEQARNDRAARLADVRYRAGLANFLTVLEARRSTDTSGARVAAARGRAERARVLLWQALGGDYQPASRSTNQ